MNDTIITYLDKTFTSEGHKKFFTYLKELIKLLHEIKTYPYVRKGNALGIPDQPFFKYYANKGELVGQIKMLMNMLGLKGVEIVLDNKPIMFEFKQKEDK